MNNKDLNKVEDVLRELDHSCLSCEGYLYVVDKTGVTYNTPLPPIFVGFKGLCNKHIHGFYKDCRYAGNTQLVNEVLSEIQKRGRIPTLL